jgi:phosphoglycolate phosphatase-like HAD superfamily hydrolase
MPPLVIGFDLDMTLIDSRVGVRAAMVALVAETGAPIDADVVASRLGPPLEQELAEWVPADQIDPLADRYREIYAEIGIAGTHALPGAAASLDAVRRVSGRTLVVTAKFEANAWLCLEQTNLVVDDVVGWRHGPQKGETLLEHGASVYVGDTPPDMDAARIAGAIGVAVPTGPFTGAQLRAAGADVVLDSLIEFPTWLGTHLASPANRAV